MMKSPIMVWFMSLLITLGSACGASPASPATHFNVKDYGAKGDGKEVDSEAINRAILAATENGGGTIVIPPGRYLCASIRLKSNIILSLEAGSTLEAVDDRIAKYDPPEPNEMESVHHYQDYGHSHWQNSLIWGIGLENVSIVGPGLIYGKGLHNGFNRFADETKGERRYKDGGPGSGNKAIALRDCRNVILRDFSLLHGGHFGILATGVTNLTVENLKIDTNRDGMDIDACQNVRITRCSVNSPWDDGICLKASFALGEVRHCDNITISDCYVAGNFDEGTLIDGTFKRSAPEYKSYRTGRIKLGTESNGDFKNIAITNCIFDDCRGLAIESVDGSHIEDVAISNITMRNVANSPIFIRLGSRQRGPSDLAIGTIRRVMINNVVSYNADRSLGNLISGIPGHPVEEVSISNVRFVQQGGGSKALADRVPPEEETKYPEPGMFGDLPAYVFFIRHAVGIDISHAKLNFIKPEGRSAIVLDDVRDASFDHIDAARGTDGAPIFDLRNVKEFSVSNSRGVLDTRVEVEMTRKKL